MNDHGLTYTENTFCPHGFKETDYDIFLEIVNYYVADPSPPKEYFSGGLKTLFHRQVWKHLHFTPVAVTYTEVSKYNQECELVPVVMNARTYYYTDIRLYEVVPRLSLLMKRIVV